MAQEEFTVNDLKYRVTGDKTVECIGGSQLLLQVDIPSTVDNGGKTYDVKSIGEDAFKWKNIESVKIPSSIDSVRKNAFSSCKIKELVISDGVKYIGEYAFSYNKLTSLKIPGTVKVIDRNAFSSCTDLTSLTLDEGIKIIGASAFYHCGITKLTIPVSCDSIMKTAFLRNDKLTDVVLNEGLVKIGAGAFNSCTSLRNITIPNTVETIESEAFLNDISLEKFNIPAKLVNIGETILGGTSVSNIELAPANTEFVKLDNVIYSANKQILYFAPVKGLTEYTVNSNCLAIMSGAFWGSSVQKVTLPEGFVAIGYAAFLNSKLSQINFPSSLIFIDAEVFGQTQLTRITLPENVPFVNDAQFYGCESLEEVTVPSSVKLIAAHAFGKCVNLRKVNFKSSAAPVIGSFYDDWDNPFYKVENATAYIPKGSLSSYENEGWSSMLKLQETDLGTLQHVAITPKDSAVAENYQGESFQISFAEPIKLLNSSPDVFIRISSLTSPRTIEPASGEWKARISDQKDLVIFGTDDDGFVDSFKTKPDETYLVVIPAGVVANNAGEENEQIIITLLGSDVAAVEQVEASKDISQGQAVGVYNLNGMRLDRPQKGINILKMSDGSSRKVLVK